MNVGRVGRGGLHWNHVLEGEMPVAEDHKWQTWNIVVSGGDTVRDNGLSVRNSRGQHWSPVEIHMHSVHQVSKPQKAKISAPRAPRQTYEFYACHIMGVYPPHVRRSDYINGGSQRMSNKSDGEKRMFLYGLLQLG